jgi:hypothetical protein
MGLVGSTVNAKLSRDWQLRDALWSETQERKR